MNIGDYVTFKKYGIFAYQREPEDQWRVVSFDKETITVKSKDVGGLFTFKRSSILKIHKKNKNMEKK